MERLVFSASLFLRYLEPWHRKRSLFCCLGVRQGGEGGVRLPGRLGTCTIQSHAYNTNYPHASNMERGSAGRKTVRHPLNLMVRLFLLNVGHFRKGRRSPALLRLGGLGAKFCAMRPACRTQSPISIKSYILPGETCFPYAAATYTIDGLVRRLKL